MSTTAAHAADTDVVITLPADVARAVLRAVEDDPDRSKWGHHQWNRLTALSALREALTERDAEHEGGEGA